MFNLKNEQKTKHLEASNLERELIEKLKDDDYATKYLTEVILNDAPSFNDALEKIARARGADSKRINAIRNT